MAFASSWQEPGSPDCPRRTSRRRRRRDSVLAGLGMSRGGYAFLDPGSYSAWRPLLSRRAGRIVIACEHTSERWQGYMNGAVESGQRAAREDLR